MDEDELAGDESDKAPALCLMIPDQRALAQLLLIWERWQAGTLVTGQKQWGDVFSLLRALRTWGRKIGSMAPKPICWLSKLKGAQQMRLYR